MWKAAVAWDPGLSYNVVQYWRVFECKVGILHIEWLILHIEQYFQDIPLFGLDQAHYVYQAQYQALYIMLATNIW